MSVPTPPQIRATEAETRLESLESQLRKVVEARDQMRRYLERSYRNTGYRPDGAWGYMAQDEKWVEEISSLQRQIEQVRKELVCLPV